MRAGPELAWLQLTKQKGHFLAAISGVAFAVALMFSQIGLRDALLISSTDLYRHLDADLIMTSWEYRFQQGTQFFPQARSTQALSVPGVLTAEPIWISLQPLENPETHRSATISVIGFRPATAVWRLDGKPNLERLTEPDTVLYDADSRSLFGPVDRLLARQGHVPLLAARHLVEAVGSFNLMPSFGTDGYLFMGDETYRSVSPGFAEPMVCAIRLQPGADPASVLAELRAAMPPDVRFWTRDGLIEVEKRYWLEQSAVGVVFTAMLALAIVVGAVVVYQILYSDVTNHLPEYATMKAMGYADGKLFRLILLQSVYISVLGFACGEGFGEIIFVLLRRATLLPMALTVPRTLEVYGMTLAMCAVSGSLAMLALRGADPAEIF